MLKLPINDDGYGDKKGKKAIGLFRETIALHVRHAFLYISLPLLHDYDVREENSTTFFFFSWLLIESFRIKLPKKSPRLEEMNMME